MPVGGIARSKRAGQVEPPHPGHAFGQPLGREAAQFGMLGHSEQPRPLARAPGDHGETHRSPGLAPFQDVTGRGGGGELGGGAGRVRSGQVDQGPHVDVGMHHPGLEFGEALAVPGEIGLDVASPALVGELGKGGGQQLFRPVPVVPGYEVHRHVVVGAEARSQRVAAVASDAGDALEFDVRRVQDHRGAGRQSMPRRPARPVSWV